MRKFIGRQKSPSSVDNLPNFTQVQDLPFRLDIYKYAFIHYNALLKLGWTDITFEQTYQGLMERSDSFEVPKELIKEYETECAREGRKPYRF